jgi:type IV secretion system protein VirD4
MSRFLSLASGLPLGWSTPQLPTNRAIGFLEKTDSSPDSKLLLHQTDGHLLTVAPTGAGKGVSSVIPALLSHSGSALVIDVKGENVQVTARRRREMGHRVVTLDPFHVLGKSSDGLNPFDILNLPGSDIDCDIEMLTELLSGGMTMISKDPFWDLTGRGLITGLVGLISEEPQEENRHIGKVLDWLYADNLELDLHNRVDKKGIKGHLARQEVVAYLSHEADKCRPSVRSTAQTFVKCLGSYSVRQCLSKTTFDLNGWYRGEPIDIYIVFPPDKLESHRGLLRLLLGTLLTVLLRRQVMPAQRTLLLLDECAQLGSLPQLRTALSLLRGYGVTVWTFWQDLSQLKFLYPNDWESVLNNSAVVQSFGLTNGWMARHCAELFGMTAKELLALKPTEQVMLRAGNGLPEQTRRMDYRTDPLFQGMFDQNPRYGSQANSGRAA